jgi:hypothetical protein
MLAREHLGRNDDDEDDLFDPAHAYDAFEASARRLDDWHSQGRRGLRPAGQLRTYITPQLSRQTKAWAAPLYRLVYDPDGRPLAKRLQRQF